jgi:adenylylsulfate kinase-like enzyme
MRSHGRRTRYAAVDGGKVRGRSAVPLFDCRPSSRVEPSRDVAADDVSGCVIVTGMPAAGKTTITSLAAALMPRAAQVSGDAVNLMIRSGYVWFMGQPSEQALRQDELCNRNMCSLANNFVDFGFTVLMDTVLADRCELDFFIALMSPRPVRLVVLDPGIDVCRRRNAGRDPETQFDFDGYERLGADMRREFGDIGWWLDTSASTAAQTADGLVAELPSRTTALHPGWNAWLRRLHGV